MTVIVKALLRLSRETWAVAWLREALGFQLLKGEKKLTHNTGSVQSKPRR